MNGFVRIKRNACALLTAHPALPEPFLLVVPVLFCVVFFVVFFAICPGNKVEDV